MALSGSEPNPTTIERRGDRELVVSRSFDAPARLVFEAWTRPELFMRWWAPKSMGVPLRSCDMDVRTGGGYRLEFGKEGEQSFAFFGKYIEVAPNARLVWTNDEGGAEDAVTTVTFEETDGRTLLTYREIFPSKEVFEEGGGIMPEQLDQLEALLAEMAAGAGS